MNPCFVYRKLGLTSLEFEFLINDNVLLKLTYLLRSGHDKKNNIDDGHYGFGRINGL